jgi:hypothetical protein
MEKVRSQSTCLLLGFEKYPSFEIQETPQLEEVAKYSDIRDGNIKVFQNQQCWPHPRPFGPLLLTRIC